MINAFLLLFLILSASASKAQLANTRWSGTMAIPSSVNVILEFKADTLNLIVVPGTGDAFVGEAMHYAVNGNVITLKKISGNSPCDVDKPFTLTYSIAGDHLSIKPLADDCEARSNSWPAEPFEKAR